MTVPQPKRPWTQERVRGHLEILTSNGWLRIARTKPRYVLVETPYFVPRRVAYEFVWGVR